MLTVGLYPTAGTMIFWFIILLLSLKKKGCYSTQKHCWSCGGRIDSNNPEIEGEPLDDAHYTHILYRKTGMFQIGIHKSNVPAKSSTSHCWSHPRGHKPENICRFLERRWRIDNRIEKEGNKSNEEDAEEEEERLVKLGKVVKIVAKTPPKDP